MRLEKTDLILIIIALLAIFLFTGGSKNFLSTFGPRTVTVTPRLVGNKYVASVTWLKYTPKPWCGGDLQPYTFKIRGIHSEYLKQPYCYLKLEKIQSQPCYGRTWGWTIENVTLYTPLKNGICDFFHEGKILNPHYTKYVYFRNGKPPYKSTCAVVSCLGLIKASSQGAKGTLYLLIRPNSFQNCQALTGSYCTSDKSYEVRHYYCEKNYGSDTKCFAGHCTYTIDYTHTCSSLQICKNGSCVTSPMLYKGLILSGIVIVLIIAVIWWKR